MFILLMEILYPEYKANAELKRMIDKSTMWSCACLFLIFMIYFLFTWHKENVNV